MVFGLRPAGPGLLAAVSRFAYEALCTPLVLRRPNYAVTAVVGVALVLGHVVTMWLDWRIDACQRPLQAALARADGEVTQVCVAVGEMGARSGQAPAHALESLERATRAMEEVDGLSSAWAVAGLGWENDLPGDVTALRFRLQELDRAVTGLASAVEPATREALWPRGLAAGAATAKALQAVRVNVDRVTGRDLAVRLALRVPILAGTLLLSAWASIALRHFVRAERRARMRAEYLTEEMETRLEPELLRLGSAVEQATDGIAILDREGHALYANPALLRMVGVAPDALARGREAMEAEAECGPLAPLREAARSGEHWSERVRLEREGVEPVDLDVSVSPVGDPSGQTTHSVAVVRDVTELVALEALLRQAQKMEAVGRLAGGVAHDFNNVLNAISGHAELLVPRVACDREAARSAAIIAQSARRASQLTGRLLAFARRTRPSRASVDALDLVSSTLSLVERTVDPRVTVAWEPPAEALTILGDAGQLQTALLNLVLNACDAMPDGGRLTLRARIVAAGDVTRRSTLNEPAAVDHVELVVSDTGCGIPASAMPRIFEPFYTTKPPGQGTGLGLSTSYGIVRDHGGTLAVKSRPGRGTTLSVFLPVCMECCAAEPILEARPAAPRSGSILVVDDDDVNRDLASEVLRALGYTVATAADGHECVERFRDSGGAFDLVLLDLTMPRLGGREAFHILRGIRPDARVLICSALGLDCDVQSLLDEGAAGVVAKPYDIASLDRAVLGAIQPAVVSV